MKMFQSFITEPTNIEYEGKDKDEHIIYIFRKSFIINYFWFLTVIILLVAPLFVVSSIPSYYGAGFITSVVAFYYLFTLGYGFVQLSNWFFNVYIISDKKIVDVDLHGIGYKNISEAPIESIEDVTSKISGIFGMTFNIGNIYVQTAAAKTEFEFIDIDNPNYVRDLISDLSAHKKGGYKKHEHNWFDFSIKLSSRS